MAKATPKATTAPAPAPAVVASEPAIHGEVRALLALYPTLPAAWLTPEQTPHFDYPTALLAVGGDETQLTEITR